MDEASEAFNINPDKVTMYGVVIQSLSLDKTLLIDEQLCSGLRFKPEYFKVQLLTLSKSELTCSL